MSKCSVSFVPALFAGVVAGTSLATVTDLRAQVISEAQAASPVQVAATSDSCLSAPKGATPSGSHWYYRIDRVTKRQCWYLREESDKADDKFARAAPPASAPAPASAAVEPAPAQPQAISTKSIAEARAEWVSQQKRTDSNSPARADIRTVAAAPAPAAQNVQRAAMPNVLAPAPLANARWNDAPTTRSLTPPTDQQIAAVNAPADQPVQAEEAQQPAAEQVAPVAAEPAKPTASLQMLLLVMAAALALAGLTVSAIVRIGRMRARRAMRRKRRAMWDSARTKRSTSPKVSPAPKLSPSPKLSPAPVLHDEDIRPRRSGVVHHARDTRAPEMRAPEDRTRVPRERPRPPESYAPKDRRPVSQPRPVPQERERPVPQDRERQVKEMLSRLARSAQT
jgi:hypothetical protein